MSAPSLAYTPGDWVAIIGPELWALVELRIDDPRVQTLWEAAARGTDDALDVLLRDGLRSLPGFAIVSRDGSGLRYAVRRPALLATCDSDVPTTIDGLDADAWHGGRLPNLPKRVTLQASDAHAQLHLPTGAGITSAAALAINFEGEQVSDARPTSQGTVSAAVVADSDRESHADTYYQLLVSSTADRDALLSKLAVVEDAETQPSGEDGLHADPEPHPRMASEETSVWIGEPDEYPGSIEDTGSAGAPPSGVRVIDGLPWAGAADASRPAATGPGRSVPNGFAPLSGPSRPLTAPTAFPNAASEPRDTPVGEATPPVPPTPPPAIRPPAAQRAPREEVDPSAMTTSRAALLRLLAEDRPAGPTVLALRCGLGHLSPSYVVTCRVCGSPLPEQDPHEVARPPLGRLVLSNGGTVVLDRGVIFGRSPESDIADPAHRPNLVRLIDSGEISRMHANITLDGWQVLLRDLGSQNGTFLTLPGRETEQIRPHEDYTLEPGSRVSFAEVVTCIFEVST